MKIIKMSVDTFWKGEVRVQGQIEDETKVYQTRIFIKGSQIYDYSCSCAEGNSFRGPCVHAKALQEAFARQQKAEHTPPISTSPEIRMMIREYTNREVARILGEEEREPVYLHPYLQIRRGEVLLEARIGREKRYIVKSLDRDGYYLLCFESATGEVNAVMMIVLYDENNMPLYEFTEN